jgi:hypothetical protein
LFKK